MHSLCKRVRAYQKNVVLQNYVQSFSKSSLDSYGDEHSKSAIIWKGALQIWNPLESNIPNLESSKKEHPKSGIHGKGAFQI